MAASNNTSKTGSKEKRDAAEVEKLSVAHNLETVDEQFNSDTVVPAGKIPNEKKGPDAKAFKLAANKSRFSMVDLADVTTIAQFREEMAKVLKPLQNKSFKKNTPLVTQAIVDKSFPGDWKDCGSDELVDRYFIDVNDLITVGAAVRRLLLKMTFTLKGLASKDYQDMMIAAYMALNTASLNYKQNISSCRPIFTNEIETRSRKRGSTWATSSEKRGYGNSIARCKTNMASLTKHINFLNKVILAQTANNFKNMILVVSKAGIRHGTDVANSHRKAMNGMMDNFDGIVKGMNSDFEKKLTDLNTAWELKYNNMETLLLAEISRLEDVITESQRLNKEYASQLDSLLTRVENLNATDPTDRTARASLARESASLYSNNDKASSNFKNVKEIADSTDPDSYSSKQRSKNVKIVAGIGVSAAVVGTAMFLLLKDPGSKKKKRGVRNG